MRELEENIKRILIEFKNKAELMLDLAYSSLILRDREIAEEVLKLEEYFDWLYTQFQLMVLTLTQKNSGKSEVFGLIRLSIAMETMADAAAKIAETVLRGLDLSVGGRLFSLIAEEGEEFVSVAQITENSKLVGKTIKDSNIEKDLDIQIIAVRRGKKWYFDPPTDFKLEIGDVIVVRGYTEALDDIRRIAGGV